MVPSIPRIAIAVVIVCLLGLGAGEQIANATSSSGLPPTDRDELARIFDPKLRPLGLRTTRALLQNENTYAQDPRGRHLAVYAEPLEDGFSDAAYLARLPDVLQVYLPRVFRRWRQLETFDVCLEPRPNDDPRSVPAPFVQVGLSRSDARRVRWTDLTLARLLEQAVDYDRRPSSARRLFTYFDPRLDTQPALIEARTAADVSVPTTTTSSTR